MLDQIRVILAALCAGLCVTCSIIFLHDIISAIRVDKRKNENRVHNIPLVFRVFLPFSPNFHRICSLENMKEFVRKTTEQLNMAGFDEDSLSAEQFITIRILLTVMGAMFTIFFFMAEKPVYGLLVLLCAFAYPTTWLKSTINRRHLEILKALPNVLDLLTLSVEAGKDFLSALRDILERRKQDELGFELSKALHEIQLGKARQQALREMSNRVKHPELTSVLNSIIQSDELGVSIGQTLRIQGEQLRQKRFALAEKLAGEAPVKILFPIAIFIFPAVFAIIAAPILLRAMEAFK